MVSVFLHRRGPGGLYDEWILRGTILAVVMVNVIVMMMVMVVMIVVVRRFCCSRVLL